MAILALNDESPSGQVYPPLSCPQTVPSGYDGSLLMADSTNPLGVSWGPTMTNPLPVYIDSLGIPLSDSFGRVRMSQPFTLFDSSHRYADNSLWSSGLSVGGSSTFNSNEGLIDLSVTTSANSEVVRETLRVFPYLPGKSLLVMNTFVMNSPKANLRQRVGYFGSSNGFYLELGSNSQSLCFVKRSSVTGSPVETRVTQQGGIYGSSDTGWNIDKMDGSGPSGLSLNITKSQILYMDLEWLGVGTVIMGFVINRRLIPCHAFNHANIESTTYITTASLPLRYEIKNTAATTSSSTLKQICSTVISEGGYELRGSQQAIGVPITSPKVLTVAGTLYPLVSLRLKSDRLDSIAIVSALSLMGLGNNEKYQWALLGNPSLSGGTWNSTTPDSSVEYSLDASSVSGGRALAFGYFSSSNQGSPTIEINKSSLFSMQLERNSLTSTPYPIVLAIAGSNASQSVYASLDWEEISR